MKELYREYANHIDILREEAGIKINDFCEGIIEPRTYRYYLNGERVMSQKVLNQLCKKLKLTPAEFFSSYSLRDKDEYQSILNLYTNIKKRDFLEARKLLIFFDKKTFKNTLSQSIYDYCVIEYNYQTNTITKESAYESFQKLINYPDCLKKKSFSFLETITIQSIAMIEQSIKDYTALTFLEKFLLDPTYELISSNRQDILPNLYATVAFGFGMNEEYERMVTVAKRGIQVVSQYEIYHDLDKLYYYVLFGNFKLGKEYKEYIPKYLGVVMIKYDKQYLKGRIKMLERDGIDNPFQYIENYFN